MLSEKTMKDVEEIDNFINSENLKFRIKEIIKEELKHQSEKVEKTINEWIDKYFAENQDLVKFAFEDFEELKQKLKNEN